VPPNNARHGRSSIPRRPFPAAILLVLAATACSVTEDPVQQVGATVLILTDPDLAVQSVTDPQAPIQVAEWELSEATLFIEEASRAVDLLFGETCSVTDTVSASPTAEGRCEEGVVIGTGDDFAVQASVSLTFTMKVRRAEPVELSPTGDLDGDGVPDQADLCPYVYDPGQTDDNLDGLGDACSVFDPFAGKYAIDSDGDGWPDRLDNCVWHPNPEQTNTTGVSEDGIADGIGDACTEQIATVRSGGSETIHLDRGPVALTELRNQIGFLTLDYRGESSLSCNWTTLFCDLDVTQIELCADAGLGGRCP
jgi:hypothetical protein